MQRHFFLPVICLILALACSGCKQSPHPCPVLSIQARQQLLQAMQNWQAEGRVAIHDQQQAQNASYTWKQQHQHFNLYFYSPFSSESVTISGCGQQISVVAANGATQEEVSLERQLPFAQLAYWAKGMPAPSSKPQSISYDAINQLQSLQQDCWTIEYQSYQTLTPVSLPEKLSLTNGTTKVKLLIKRWQN